MNTSEDLLNMIATEAVETHHQRTKAVASSAVVQPCSPSWVCKPSTEAWWWSGSHREWVEVSSTDLVEAHVSNSWDGPWWGPIYPPEVPTGMMENVQAEAPQVASSR